MTGAQAALTYVLRNAEVATAVFGTTTSRHLHQNLEAAGKPLPADVLKRIETPDGAGRVL
jgi:1-deoxyxylulose-5-phosphate synthase